MRTVLTKFPVAVRPPDSLGAAHTPHAGAQELAAPQAPYSPTAVAYGLRGLRGLALARLARLGPQAHLGRDTRTPQRRMHVTKRQAGPTKSSRQLGAQATGGRTDLTTAGESADTKRCIDVSNDMRRLSRRADMYDAGDRCE